MTALVPHFRANPGVWKNLGTATGGELLMDKSNPLPSVAFRSNKVRGQQCLYTPVEETAVPRVRIQPNYRDLLTADVELLR